MSNPHVPCNVYRPIEEVLRPNEEVFRTFSTQADIEEEKQILERAFTKLVGEPGFADDKSSWKSLSQLVQHLQALNGRFSALMKELKVQECKDSSVFDATESE